MTTFQDCRRRWNWGYNQGLESPKYNTNLSTGSAVHKALQGYYSGGDPFTALTDYWTGAAEAIHPEDPSMAQLAKDVKLSQIMIEGYLEWLAESNADAYLTPVCVEQKVEMLLTPDVTLHGTLDLVMVDGDGNFWLIDHKTTASFGALADRRLQLNFQLLTYAVLCEEYFGVAPTGAILNMLRKVQRTAASKPPFFQREPVHFNRYQLDGHRAHMRAILSELLATESAIASGDNAVAYPHVTGDCSWKCPFLSVCPMADDGSDINGALNDLYVRRDDR